jgi:hypothetical protein
MAKDAPSVKAIIVHAMCELRGYGRRLSYLRAAVVGVEQARGFLSSGLVALSSDVTSPMWRPISRIHLSKGLIEFVS